MIEVLRAADQRVVPWKNGLGTTREVAVDPPDGDVTRGFRWRVSLATIERDCPFSAFPGHDRAIVVARGPGMTLVVDGREHAMRCAAPVVTFPGEATTSCRLAGGPIVDLNLMTDRARARGRLEVATLDGEERVEVGDEAVVAVLLGGRATLRHGDRTIVLGELDAVRAQGSGASFTLASDSVQAVAIARVSRSP